MPLPPNGVAPRFDSAVLLANGHVLMPTKDVVYDWEPFAPPPSSPAVPPMRRVSLGDAGPSHTFSFVPLGGKTFVVAKADEKDNVRFELWDAEKLAVIRALEGSYVAEEPIVDFSRDGKRVMLLACAAPRSEARVCDVGVYDLSSGALIHRTKLPPLASKDHNRVAGKLAPSGKYFALSGDDFTTEAYDAETGRPIVVQDPTAIGAEADIEDGEETPQIVHFAFVDERRILTASLRAGLRLTDLTSGRSKTYSLGGSGGASTPANLRIVLSPDRACAATEITRNDGSFGLVIANFDGDQRGGDPRGDQDQRAQRVIVVPRRVCPSTCAMRWSAPREIVLAPNVEGTPLEFRVNAQTGNAAAQAYRDPPPFDVFEAHFVHGAFDKYSSKDSKDSSSSSSSSNKDGKGKWSPEDRSKAYPKGALITPQGVRLSLASFDMSALMSATPNRFFIQGLDSLRLIRSDGTTETLARTARTND